MSNKQDGMVEALRLAIREEGPFINAYLAQPGTMKDAKLIGSISTGLCKMDRQFFEQFKDTMARATIALTEAATGAAVVFGGERPAPEHERAGHA